MNPETKDIEISAIDAMIDKPYSFMVDNINLCLYHQSLGKSKLISRLYTELGLNLETVALNPFVEYLRICKEHRNIVLRILAYNTLQSKEEIFNETTVKERIQLLTKLDESELAELMMLSVTMDNMSLFAKHLGITEESDRLHVISTIKSSNSSTITIGGVSEYGGLIAKACESFGWTYDYVVWGISLNNLYLLLKDMVVSVLLTDEEKKKIPRSFLPKESHDEKIDMNNPDSWAEIMKMKYD